MILKLAIRNIFRHRARSLVSLSTITFGCVALIFIGGFFEDVYSQIRIGFIKSQTGHLQINKAGYHQYGKSDPYQYLIANPSPIKDMLLKMPEVLSVVSRIEFSGLVSTGDNTVSFFGQGVEPQTELYMHLPKNYDIRKAYQDERLGMPVMIAGTDLSERSKDALVMGQGLAEILGVKVNDTVTILTQTVDDSSNAVDRKVGGIYFTNSKMFDDGSLRIPLTLAQRLLGTEGVQTLIVNLKKTEDTQKVKAKLAKIFADQNLKLEVRAWNELVDFYNKTIKLFDAFHTVMRVVTVIVVALGIFNTMNMAAMERVSEIGTLVALGTRRRGVLLIFLVEGIMLGTIGGIIGMIAGVVVVSGVAQVGIVMPPAPGAAIPWLSHPIIVPKVLAVTFLLAILIGAISAFFPAYRASRLTVIEALRFH